MKKIVSFTDLVQAVGLLILLLSVFAGILFFFKGNLILSITLTILLIGVLFGLVFVLVKLKKAEENMRKMRVIETMILTLVYFPITVAVLCFFIHFINIEFNLKQQLKTEIQEDLTSFSKLVTAYEQYVMDRIDRYEVVLANKLKHSRSRGYRGPSLTVEGQNEELEALSTKLRIDFEPLQKQMESYTRNGLNISKNWNQLEVPDLLYSISERREAFYKKLIAISIKVDADNGKPFDEILPEIKTKSLKNPIAYFGMTNWILIMPLFIIIKLMVLWPYLFARRSSRMVPNPVWKESNTIKN